MEQAVAEAVAETGAASIKDMGKVMAALKAKHAATLDMAKAGPMVKARLSAADRRNNCSMALPSSFLDELRARTPLAGGDRPAGAAGAVRAAMEGLLPVPRREDAQLLRLRRRLPLLRLRRAWRCDQLRHAEPGRRLHGGGRATGGRSRAGGAEALAGSGRGGTPAARPGSACWRLPKPRYQRRLLLPEGRPRAGLPAGPRPDRGDHSPLRPGLVRRGPRRADGGLGARRDRPRSSWSRPD